MTSSSHVIAFAPSYNSPTAKHPKRKDATGAFLPELDAFARSVELVHGLRTLPVRWSSSLKGTPLALARQVNGVIESAPADYLVCVAFFCHGFKHGLQTGHSFRARSGPRSVDALARVLARSLARTGVVVMYCCDAGRDDDADTSDERVPGPGGAGGFASRLARAISEHRPGWIGYIDAHTTAAHTTWNPYVRRFYATDHTDDGFWIVEPPGRDPVTQERTDVSRWRSWVAQVGRKSESDLRYRYPFMSRGAVRELLR